MKAKVIFIVLLVAAVSATTAFASGTKDNPAPATGPWGRGWNAPDVSEKTVQVAGKLSLQDAWHPVLKSDKESYYLMVPRPYLYGVDLKEGNTVKVEGYLVENAPWQSKDDKTKALLVTKATIDGKDYEVPRGPLAMGGGGWGAGRGYGRGYGYGHGPSMMGRGWGRTNGGPYGGPYGGPMGPGWQR